MSGLEATERLHEAEGWRDHQLANLDLDTEVAWLAEVRLYQTWQSLKRPQAAHGDDRTSGGDL